MATKRTKRVDPNAAFAAILGGGGEDTMPEAVAIEEVHRTTIDSAPVSPIIKVSVPSDASKTNGEPEGNISAADSLLEQQKDTATSKAAEPIKEEAPIAVPTEETPVEPRLVQKGYYITEEQHRQLGITAVMQGVDRSHIVRTALEAYFRDNPV